MTPPLSHCAGLVRNHDPDRFLSTLFAPVDRREALFAVYAFAHETGKTAQVVSEPAVGMIRLQWWRETVEDLAVGRVRRHPVAEALADAIETHGLNRDWLLRAIDARERDLEPEPPQDMAALAAHVRAVHEPVFALAFEALDAGGAGEAAATAGTAWGLAHVCRRVGADAAARRRWLPDAVMREAGARDADLFSGRATKNVRAALDRVAGEARAALAEAQRHAETLPRAVLPAFMPLGLAGQALDRQTRRGGDVLLRPAEPSRPAKQWHLIRCAIRHRVLAGR